MTYALKDFGSYTVGGRLHTVTTGTPREIQFTRDVVFTYDPRGTFAVEHAYVQYYVPEARNTAPPVLMVHGGGMHGGTWETTPDGRPGWLHLLLQRGFEVHVIDNVERGRAGFLPGLWESEPITRSLEEAWSLFRIGPAGGHATQTAHPNQQFPFSHFNAFARQFVPRWLDTTPLHVAAVCAALERIGPALVCCHSQGGEIVFDAHAFVPDLMAAIIAVEPSVTQCDVDGMRVTPLVLVAGDYLDADLQIAKRSAGWRNTVVDLQRAGGTAVYLDTALSVAQGGSHMLMMDYHNEACLDAALSALSALGVNRAVG